jgi:fluoride ion exporter CrcB/FEX
VDLILLIWVGIGGASGSIARYLLAYVIEWQQPSGFPYATLAVNTLAALNVLLNVSLSILATFGGFALARRIA